MQTLLSLFIDHLLQLVTNQGLFAEVIAAHRERSIAQILAAANDYHEGLAAAGGSGFSIRPLQDAIRLSRFAHTPGEAAFTFNAALCYVNRRNIVWTVELQQKISSSAATLQAILLSFQVYRDEECVKSLSGNEARRCVGWYEHVQQRINPLFSNENLSSFITEEQKQYMANQRMKLSVEWG
jgi:hypothetical protein